MRAQVVARDSDTYFSGEAALLNSYYAPDPSSQISYTTGGNVVGSQGDVRCLKNDPASIEL